MKFVILKGYSSATQIACDFNISDVKDFPDECVLEYDIKEYAIDFFMNKGAKYNDIISDMFTFKKALILDNKEYFAEPSTAWQYGSTFLIFVPLTEFTKWN
jgi:hypothetical protein